MNAVKAAPIEMAPLPDADPWEILAGLRALRANLWLGVVGEPAAGVSVILSVLPGEGAFVIDALRSEEGSHGALRVGQALYFDTQVEGRRLRLECRLRQVVTLADGGAYLCDQPRVVVDLQRRAAYRVRLGNQAAVRAAILDGDGINVSARVVDLSESGCGASVFAPFPSPAGSLVRVRVDLPELELSSLAEVRHVLPSPSGGTRVGLQFSIQDALAQHRLAQAVTRLQRQVLRERH